MPNYAIHDGNVVVNVIVADTPTIAQQVTGLNAIETTGTPWIGWTRHKDGWRPPAPSDGEWEWDNDSGSWIEILPVTEGEPSGDPANE